MSEAATDAGFLCVYIDVWQNRSDVLGAINYGLQEAIDDLGVPKGVVAQRLKTTVKKVAAGPFGLDLATNLRDVAQIRRICSWTGY
jgi:hypothetical protein